MDFENLDKRYYGPVLNGVFSGELLSSSVEVTTLIPKMESFDVSTGGPLPTDSIKIWKYEYREFWFRNKKYGAWVTVGTSDEAFNTLSAGYAMDNLL